MRLCTKINPLVLAQRFCDTFLYENRLIQLLGSHYLASASTDQVFLHIFKLRLERQFGCETNVRRVEITTGSGRSVRDSRIKYLICHFSCLQAHLAAVPMKTQRKMSMHFLCIIWQRHCCCIGIRAHNQFHCTRFSFFGALDERILF